MGATSRTGTRLGAFTVGPPLGRGGTAEIYHATEATTGRAVALKILREDLMQYEEIVARFYREARAAERVRHPNVVDVYAVGKDERGTPFIVQEFLHGEDLNRYVTRCGGKLSVEHTLLIMMPVIEAVAFAHQRSVVHRDLKPENVFLSKVGDVVVPKLLDFGISRIQESSEARLTTAGESIGTPAYMSPEQIQSSGDVDSRTDVWALGVMLFELIAGRLPYPNPDPQSLFVEIATKPAPRLLEVARDAPLAIGRVVDRCLKHDKVERYPSATELSRDLKQTVAGDPELAAKLPHIAASGGDFVDRRGLTDWTGTPDQGVPAVRTGPSPAVRTGPNSAARPEVPIDIEEAPVSQRSAKKPITNPGASRSGGRPAVTARQAATVVVPKRYREAESSEGRALGAVVVVTTMLGVLVALRLAIYNPTGWMLPGLGGSSAVALAMTALVGIVGLAVGAVGIFAWPRGTTGKVVGVSCGLAGSVFVFAAIEIMLGAAG
ncbi:MAG: serine/threonine protein kinase [Myxococcales bacterium]|jgi:serine/threonine-protein kinase|nr:serine/threonine protein kinase [Myxococcales bacterium]